MASDLSTKQLLTTYNVGYDTESPLATRNRYCILTRFLALFKQNFYKTRTVFNGVPSF